MLNHNNKIICNDHELGKVFNEHYILYIYMYIYIYISQSAKRHPGKMSFRHLKDVGFANLEDILHS